ncbi:replication protein RepA [Bifidobacterium xylocopae]|nr:replication protein RepA [Bifidobacterium xylocopae]
MAKGELVTLWPSGKYARLMLIWISTQVTRAQDSNNHTIPLPQSLRQLMRDLHISRDPRGTDYRLFREQLQAISSLHINITDDLSTDTEEMYETQTITMATKTKIGWTYSPGDEGHINGYITLTDETWDKMKKSVPLDDEVLEVLVQAYRGHGQLIDIYMWLSLRIYGLNHSSRMQTSVITWKQLEAQFGGSFHERKEFTRSFKSALEKVAAIWPGLHYEIIDKEGIVLKRSRQSVTPKRKPSNTQ